MTDRDKEERKVKREMMAACAMMGLLAGNAIYNGMTTDRATLAKDAVAHADALLKELEKTDGER